MAAWRCNLVPDEAPSLIPIMKQPNGLSFIQTDAFVVERAWDTTAVHLVQVLLPAIIDSAIASGVAPTCIRSFNGLA